MSSTNDSVCIWNVRGLNSVARRNVLRATVRDEHITLICVEETKLATIDDHMILQLLGAGFDFAFKPAVVTCGGILVAWRTDRWEVSSIVHHSYALSVRIMRTDDPEPWWLTTVYGPFGNNERATFLQEIRDFRASNHGPWALTGDFNLIYQARDKNRGQLDRRWMARFRSFLDALALREMHLHGRRYTWSNERQDPTLVRLDRLFFPSDWEELFPDCLLHAASTLGSDHYPIILHTAMHTPREFRFRFESFWTRFDDFLPVVTAAWTAEPGHDPLRQLRLLFENTARALQPWNSRWIGSVKLQFLMVKEIILRLEVAQETRQLSPLERDRSP